MKYHNFKIETKTSVTWKYSINDHPIKGYIDTRQKIYFHLIPKNASSFLAGHVIGLNWQPIKTLTDADFTKGLIIIRDPLMRWVSGITQFFYDAGLITYNFENDWDVYKKILMHNPIQDAHTSPQEEFLFNLDLDKFNFIFLSEPFNVGEKVQAWLANQGYINNFHKFETQNTANTSIEKSTAKRLIKQTLDVDLELKTSLQDHFKSSYALIEWINQQQKWS